jgi:hypothetical protein
MATRKTPRLSTWDEAVYCVKNHQKADLLHARNVADFAIGLIFGACAIPAAFCFADEPKKGAMHVDVLDVDGKPIHSVYVILWREIDQQSKKPGYFDCDWTDSLGRHWRRESDWASNDGRGDFRGEFAYLTPGNYRVTVASVQKRTDYKKNLDPTPFGFSEALEVPEDGKPAKVVVQLVDGSPLEIKVVDQATGKPIEYAQVRLLGPDGQPIVSSSWGDGNFFERTDSDGVVRFGHLPAGEYQVASNGQWPDGYFPGVVRYLPTKEPQETEIIAGQNNVARLELEPQPLTEQEIHRSWPYIYYGRVTDIDGKPLSEVPVKVFSGLATCFCVAETKTDDNGMYATRFAQGGIIFSEDWQIAGMVYARKPGWGDIHDYTQGNLWLVPRKPVPKTWLDKQDEDPAKFVAPNEPRQVDFVLAPEIAVEGRLLDADDKPLASYTVTLESKEQPPGYRDSKTCITDSDGKFKLTEVSPVRWFSVLANPPESKQKISTSLIFGKGGDQSVRLKLKDGNLDDQVARDEAKQ